MWDFQVFRLKCVEFPMLILKRQVNSSSNFASFINVMTHNSFVNFNLILFLLWIKRSHQSRNSETFKCSGEMLPHFSGHFPNHRSVFLQILHVMKDNSSVLSLGQLLNTFHYRNQWNCKFLRLWSTRAKIPQILVIFETTDQFFFKFCVNFLGHEA